MTTQLYDQFIRKCGLFLYSETDALDLSNFRIIFEIQNADIDSPNNAVIRVYNLSRKTMRRLIDNAEFQKVSLNAGYQNGNYGVIFQGAIKQFRIGKESNTITFLDILAADGDIAYNQGFLNETLARGHTQVDAIEGAAKAMKVPVDYGKQVTDSAHVPSIRGKVRMGMARAYMRTTASTLDASWSIQQGRLQILNYKGYLDNEIVVLNASSGLIGIPEQTDEGIRLKCLLNSKLRIGSLIQINNSLVNQTIFNGQIQPPYKYEPAAVPYNVYKGLQPLAPLTDDGVYRIFVCEHEGDTRGQAWYTNLIGLAFDLSGNRTVAR